jgi:hypothetical protein
VTVTSSPDAPAPREIQEYASQAVDYVRRALGLELAYDSDTLPLLDHYLHTVPQDQPATLELVALTAGAYFGEVVRRRLGGRWDMSTGASDALGWRMVLPTGIHFSPAGFVAAAIIQDDLDDLDTALDAPPRTRPHLERALERMGDVTVEDYYSLCGRLDTLEHVHEVLVAVAAKMLGQEKAAPSFSDSDDDGGSDEGGDGADAVDPTAPAPRPPETNPDEGGLN